MRGKLRSLANEYATEFLKEFKQFRSGEAVAVITFAHWLDRKRRLKFDIK